MSTRRQPRTDGEVLDVIERALGLYVAGDRSRAFDVLVTVCNSSDDACAAAAALAMVVARHATDGADTPVRARVVSDPGERPPAQLVDETTLAASFIAGAGNDDIAGVALAWSQASLRTQVGALVQLLGMAAAVAADAAEPGQ